jgi:hypothetical protein
LTFSSFPLLILIASAASGHPGKTDYQDGHKCLKNCEDWDMHYGEYHLHDKDRNAIRTQGRKQPLREPARRKISGPEPPKQEVVAAPAPSSPEPKTEESAKRALNEVSGQGYIMPVEEGFALTLYDIILLGVAGLLLFVMLFLRIKERKNNSL